MTERKKRVRVVVKGIITPELLRLFRKAITAELALQRGKLTPEQDKAVTGDYHAFRRAIGFPLYERFPLPHPLARGEWRELQDELLAKIDGTPEAKAWKRYVSRWQKQRDAESAGERKIARKTVDMPRLTPNLKWGGGW